MAGGGVSDACVVVVGGGFGGDGKSRIQWDDGWVQYGWAGECVGGWVLQVGGMGQ